MEVSRRGFLWYMTNIYYIRIKVKMRMRNVYFYKMHELNIWISVGLGEDGVIGNKSINFR